MSAEHVWRPGRESWPDPEGTVWNRARPRWPAEKDARRLVLRKSSLVAVEQAAGMEFEWLPWEDRASFWAGQVAGHLDDGEGRDVSANGEGVGFRVSCWRNDAGQLLVLLSVVC